MHVGKKRLDCKHGHIAYGNKEQEVQEFEILACKTDVIWERVKSWEEIKKNAVVAGYHDQNSPSYIVKVDYNQSV